MFVPPFGLVFSILAIKYYRKIKKKAETKGMVGLALGISSMVMNILFAIALVVNIIVMLSKMAMFF